MPYTTQQIRDMVVAEATRQGIDPALALAVAANESSFRADATSRKGAQGVMQLMPDTADWLGVRDPYDPQQNIEGGVRYIGMMLNQFGNPQDAIAAYNFGPGAVGRGEDQHGDPFHFTPPGDLVPGDSHGGHTHQDQQQGSTGADPPIRLTIPGNAPGGTGQQG